MNWTQRNKNFLVWMRVRGVCFTTIASWMKRDEQDVRRMWRLIISGREIYESEVGAVMEGKAWTTADDAAVISARKHNLPPKLCAAIMQRKSRSVKERFKHLKATGRVSIQKKTIPQPGKRGFFV